MMNSSDSPLPEDVNNNPEKQNEPQITRKEKLDQDIDSLFSSMGDVMKGNFDYQFNQMDLYETMMTLISSKYNLMKEKTDHTFLDIQKINEEFKSQEIRKYLNEIDILDNNAKSLVSVVEILDKKSKELIKKFKEFI